MATNSSPTSTASPTGRGFSIEPLDGFAGSAYVGLCDECGHRTKRKGSERIAEAAIRDHVKACTETTAVAGIAADIAA